MKKIYTYCTFIFFGLSIYASSDELKVGYGKFDKGMGNSESNITEITYVYDEKNLPLNLTPIAGVLSHGSGAYMIYGGVQKKFKLNKFAIIPSFAPGYYESGDEVDMGYELQFKSQIELAYDFINGYSLSYAWSHISNADLGDKNPGANNEMLYLTKKF